MIKIKVTGKDIELTEAIKSYVDEKINLLDKFFDNIQQADVVVGMLTRRHQKGNLYFADCRLSVPGKDIFVLEKDKGLYEAIDKMRDKLERELNKYKEKVYRSKQKTVNKSKRSAKEYKPDLE